MKNFVIILSLITAISGCSVDPAYKAKKQRQNTMISQFVEAAKLGEHVKYQDFFKNEITPYLLCNNLDRFGYNLNCYKFYKQISPQLKTDNETYTLVMDQLYYFINNSEDAINYRQNKAYEYAQTIPKEQYVQMMKELYDITNGISNADRKFQSTILKNSLPLALETSNVSQQGVLAVYGNADMGELASQIKKTKSLEGKIKNANENAEKRMKSDIEKNCLALGLWMKKYDHHGFEYIEYYGRTSPSDTSHNNLQNISHKIFKVKNQYCKNNL